MLGCIRGPKAFNGAARSVGRKAPSGRLLIRRMAGFHVGPSAPVFRGEGGLFMGVWHSCETLSMGPWHSVESRKGFNRRHVHGVRAKASIGAAASRAAEGTPWADLVGTILAVLQWGGGSSRRGRGSVGVSKNLHDLLQWGRAAPVERGRQKAEREYRCMFKLQWGLRQSERAEGAITGYPLTKCRLASMGPLGSVGSRGRNKAPSPSHKAVERASMGPRLSRAAEGTKIRTYRGAWPAASMGPRQSGVAEGQSLKYVLCRAKKLQWGAAPVEPRKAGVSPLGNSGRFLLQWGRGSSRLA